MISFKWWFWLLHEKQIGAQGASGSRRPVRRCGTESPATLTGVLFVSSGDESSQWKRSWKNGRKGTSVKWQDCWEFGAKILMKLSPSSERSAQLVMSAMSTGYANGGMCMTQIYSPCSRIQSVFYILYTPVYAITFVGYSLTVNLIMVQ